MRGARQSHGVQAMSCQSTYFRPGSQSTSRRRVLGWAGGLAGAAGLAGWGRGAVAAAADGPATDAVAADVVAPAQGTMTVTLLGTASPSPNPERFSAATLVQAGGRHLLFDAGRGATIRLRQLGVPIGLVDPIFLTHFHSDHTVGLPDLWLTGYIQTAYAKRSGTLRVIEPKGTRAMTTHLREAFIQERIIRIADERTPLRAMGLAGIEFGERGGLVFNESGVRVTAFRVNHGERIHRAFGFRIDHAGHSVVITGDTRYDERVVEHSRGVDLLVHEVCSAAPEVLDRFNNRAVMNHHTSPEEAGRVFAQARPKMAAYTHIIQLTDRGPSVEPDLAQIEAATRRNYDGPLVIGNDLTRFQIGDTITVQRWDANRQAYPAGV